VLPSAMGSHQMGYKMQSILVNPLIHGLMAYGQLRLFDAQSAGDQFWRPTQAKVFFHIGSNKAVFEPFSPMRFILALIGSLLGFMGQIIAGVNRRGIPYQLPGKGAGTSVEQCSNLP
jgi:hypothetical protein